MLTESQLEELKPVEGCRGGSNENLIGSIPFPAANYSYYYSTPPLSVLLPVATQLLFPVSAAANS